jgi:integrase
MAESSGKKGWERTKVTNLVRNGQSGMYYARVKVGGKEKWKSLKTTVPSVAKLKLGDFEKLVKAQAMVAGSEETIPKGREATVGRFIDVLRERVKGSKLATSSKTRTDTAIKALEKTWPDLRRRDVRKVTPTDCQSWAAKALQVGTGFVAPNAKTKRTGMSASAYNKCLDVLRSVFEIARKAGFAYSNSAAELEKQKIPKKHFELPTPQQFHEIVKAIATAGARQSEDCADMARLLAFSGVRLAEGVALSWAHVDFDKGQLTVPGTKSETSHRIVPLFPALKTFLSELTNRRGAESLDTPILRIGECKGALTSACAAIRVKRLTHHDLRHLFATRCIESGVDIPTISRWLGHSDGGALAMRTYGHLSQEHSQRQAAKVDFGGAI